MLTTISRSDGNRPLTTGRSRPPESIDALPCVWITQGWITQGWITQGWITQGWITQGWITQGCVPVRRMFSAESTKAWSITLRPAPSANTWRQ